MISAVSLPYWLNQSSRRAPISSGVGVNRYSFWLPSETSHTHDDRIIGGMRGTAYPEARNQVAEETPGARSWCGKTTRRLIRFGTF